MDFVLGLIAGLIIGWNFLKQPEWVAKLIEKMKFWKKDETPPPAAE